MNNMEPKIRFKGFSGEWETRHVGELCDVLTGFPFEGSKILPKGKELLMRGMEKSVQIDPCRREKIDPFVKIRLTPEKSWLRGSI